jgi:hypothetical protein
MNTTFAPKTVVLKAGSKFSTAEGVATGTKAVLTEDTEVVFKFANDSFTVYEMAGVMIFVAPSDEA